MLRLDIDVIGLLGIRACTDEDEFGALIVEKMRAFGRKPPAAKLLLNRITCLFPFWKAGARWRCRLRVLD